jgi:uncharacterized protein (TIGR00251 family)
MKDLFSSHEKPAWGAPFSVKVTPKARHAALRVEQNDGQFHVSISVTVAPENGKANAAVIAALAEAFGVAKSQVELIRGAHGRHKLFQLREK